MKKAFLFLNGQKINDFPKLDHNSIIFCADGAYNLYHENFGTHFVTIIGDLDSLDPTINTSKLIKKIHFSDQNTTDFDKALSYLIQEKFTHVHVFGASGKEHDHFLSNLSSAIFFQNQIEICFFDDFSYYFLAKKETVLKNVYKKTISLIPMNFVENVHTNGLLYPLKGENLQFGKAISVRNEGCKETAIISYQSGELFIFIAKN